MPKSVDIRQHGAISVVTLNRPDVRNAVDAATARALHAAFLAFDADENARVAVFHGAHGHFCACCRSTGPAGGAGIFTGRLRCAPSVGTHGAVAFAVVQAGDRSGQRRRRGQALEAALAHQITGFPQQTMLADRMSAYTQWDLSLPQALHQEWQRGKQCIEDGLQGALRFAAGSGRHGKF